MAKGKKVVPTEKVTFTHIKDEEDFAKVIKAKRTELGLTIMETSSFCQITNVTLQKLEKGSKGVRLSTALHVAKMLGIKIKFED
ncbi:MAG: helix-turn-helix transcriptional regulator [Sulfurimonas sp.]|nr:helix-turn-helix transcriptional regulator [Sulfurimonas sp.]